MTVKTFTRQIERLDTETPFAYVFVLQAANDAAPLTAAQIETARNAAKSVLEITGATVAATTAVLALDPIQEGQTATLAIDVRQEIEDA